MTPEQKTPPAKVLIVVVLYRTTLAASRTVQGLVRAAAEHPACLHCCEILLWDNSREPLADCALPFAFTYHHAPQNEGVSGAYNGARRMAEQRGCEWLLLLDDDTSVTAEFLCGMTPYARQQLSPRIAAVVPFLYAGDRQLSPQLWRFAGHRPLPRPAQSRAESRAMFAANSGTLLRAAALAAVGGYSTRFWLDYSDIELFYRLHRAGFQVRIAPELRLQHEIAMLDYDARMTPARYAIYLAAEGDFLDLYRGPTERALHLLRLGARALRQRRYRSLAFSRMTLVTLWRRLRSSPARRLSGDRS
jgi:GT2 family glycosyltransferase